MGAKCALKAGISAECGLDRLWEIVLAGTGLRPASWHGRGSRAPIKIFKKLKICLPSERSLEAILQAPQAGERALRLLAANRPLQVGNIPAQEGIRMFLQPQ